MKTTLIVIYALANLLIISVLYVEIQETKQFLNDKTLILNKEFFHAIPVYKLPQ